MKRTLPILFLLAALAAQGQLTYLPQDSILFELNSCPYYVVPSTGNCWQVGPPQKTWLNGAYSPPLALITDTVLPYPPSSTSMFLFTIDSNSTWVNLLGATYFSFIHKYDIDTLGDYGVIEYSLDGGLNWCDFSSGTCDFPYNWWESDSSLTSHETYPHPDRITGKSDGWIFSRVHMDYFVGDHKGDIPDSILIRFTFRSDTDATPYDGWAVDNIIMGACDVWLGAPGHALPDTRLEINPNPVTSSSVIKLPTGVSDGTPLLIMDASGKVIRVMTVKPGADLRIERGDLAPGIYLLRTTLGDGRPVSGRMVVK